MIVKMKVIYLVLIFFLFQCFNVYADAKISNYQDYKITKKKVMFSFKYNSMETKIIEKKY